MIDCGEGAQVQLRRSRLRFNRLNHIFISHLHGDHCFGLMGLISTFGMLERTADLHIHAHSDLQQFLLPQIDFFCKDMTYNVVFHPINPGERSVIYDDRSVSVETIPLRHRIPTCGFLFREKPTPNHIRRDMIDFYQIPTYMINRIKNGEDYTLEDGTIVPNERLTTPSAPPVCLLFGHDIPAAHRRTNKRSGPAVPRSNICLLGNSACPANISHHGNTGGTNSPRCPSETAGNRSLLCPLRRRNSIIRRSLGSFP